MQWRGIAKQAALFAAASGKAEVDSTFLDYR